jgi:hypothetical protein
MTYIPPSQYIYPGQQQYTLPNTQPYLTPVQSIGDGADPGTAGPPGNPGASSLSAPALSQISAVAEAALSTPARVAMLFAPPMLSIPATMAAYAAQNHVNAVRTARINEKENVPFEPNPAFAPVKSWFTRIFGEDEGEGTGTGVGGGTASTGGIAGEAEGDSVGGSGVGGGGPGVGGIGGEASGDGVGGSGTGGGGGGGGGGGSGGGAGAGDGDGGANAWHHGGLVADGDKMTYRNNTPIMAQEGEYMMPKDAVDYFGVELFDMLRHEASPNSPFTLSDGERKTMAEQVSRRRQMQGGLTNPHTPYTAKGREYARTDNAKPLGALRHLMDVK